MPRRKTPVERAHELNRRIMENRGAKLRVIQEFYAQMVEAGERETAELVLVIRSMMDDDNMVKACVAVLVIVLVLGHYFYA